MNGRKVTQPGHINIKIEYSRHDGASGLIRRLEGNSNTPPPRIGQPSGASNDDTETLKQKLQDLQGPGQPYAENGYKNLALLLNDPPQTDNSEHPLILIDWLHYYNIITIGESNVLKNRHNLIKKSVSPDNVGDTTTSTSHSSVPANNCASHTPDINKLREKILKITPLHPLSDYAFKDLVRLLNNPPTVPIFADNETAITQLEVHKQITPGEAKLLRQRHCGRRIHPVHDNAHL